MILDRAAISRLVPHAGAMCLLHEVLSCDEREIVCRATSHRDSTHPLRDGDILPATCGIEYGAQAIAVHGAIAHGLGGRRGMLAGARDVTFAVQRLDDIADDLVVRAQSLVVEDARLLYEFTLHAGGRELVRGRAAVVLIANGA